jgi:hypothetical protein
MDRVEQLVARERPAVGVEERDEQPQFEGAEGHGRAGERDLVAPRIDHKVPADQLFVRPESLDDGALGPSEDGPDAHHELGRGERLREVVVGTLAEPEDPIAGRAARGQDEDRGLAECPRATDDGQAVELGQHQVEDDKAGPRFLDRPKGALAIGRGHDGIALALEIGPYEGHDLRIVVDDEDRGVGSRHERHHRGPEGARQAMTVP